MTELNWKTKQEENKQQDNTFIIIAGNKQNSSPTFSVKKLYLILLWFPTIDAINLLTRKNTLEEHLGGRSPDNLK